MIAKYFILFISLVYGANQILRITNSTFLLEEVRQKIVRNHRNRKNDHYSLNISYINSVPTKEFLQGINLWEDCPFIIFWYSFGFCVGLSSRATGVNFIHDITDQGIGASIFDEMKDNYTRYMRRRLLQDLLAPDSEISKNDKEELLSLAMSLYYERFQSIWARIVRPGTEKFDNLKPTFSFYERAHILGIYGSLGFSFRKIFRNPDAIDQILYYTYEKQFYYLVEYLSNNRNENWGLRWVSKHKNPYFILCFFHFLEYHPVSCPFLKKVMEKNDDRKYEFKMILNMFGRRMGFEFDITEDGKLVFPLPKDFKNPFPSSIMEDDELKLVLTKIISKLWHFCD
jgi:hypothetical protein